MKLPTAPGHSLRMTLQALLSTAPSGLRARGRVEDIDNRELRSVEPAIATAPTTVEGLFRSHFADVYRVVGRMLGPSAPRSDIEDLTQQVFLAAHRGWDRFRGESKPSTWLYGIAV